MHSIFALLFFSLITQTLAPHQCYNADTKAYNCFAQVQGVCFKLECLYQDLRGCASKEFNTAMADHACQKMNVGNLKVNGTHFCDTELCNGGQPYIVKQVGVVIAMLLLNLSLLWII